MYNWEGKSYVLVSWKEKDKVDSGFGVVYNKIACVKLFAMLCNF